ncbi:MAG: formylglycine-generating enzyme family protein [Myxococcales bacterium]|nr:formylglycine-generating enzyme family protein [Myxococcales bacterium]
MLALAERGAVVEEAERRRAERLLVSIQRRALDAAESGDPRARAEVGHWLDYVAQHAPALFDPASAAGQALQPAWAATHEPDDPPPNADPSLLALGRGTRPGRPEAAAVRQVGEELEIIWPQALVQGRRVPPGGLVGALWAGELWVYPNLRGRALSRPLPITSPARLPAPPTPGAVIELRSDRSSLVLRALTRPPWATAIGRDHRGLWAEVEVEGVALRLRWIPPGHFTMGSLPDEPGRDDDEVEHEVVLTRGFWLGETPVTQRLWEAVMGSNPSRFKDPQRPVERMSWEDAGRFVVELNRRIDADADGAAFRLPSEAEWEYACRAGTKAATYAGAIEIRGENNAPVLDAIAWYGGNSGVGYELAQAYDSSGWPEKQYEHSRAGTREVGEKQPNPWGLHDMLGNVWEWCADAWQADRTAGGASRSASRPTGSASKSPGVQTNPYIEGSKGDHRVRRGGCWFSHAGLVRAAYRSHVHPGDRSVDLGLRLARGQGLQGPEGQPPGGR